MKVIYVTNTKKDSQCDFQEVSILHGLRDILGDDCIDFPRKKIMYGDFSESPKSELHGWGFSLLTYPIQEVSNREVDEVDFVLYGEKGFFAFEIKRSTKIQRSDLSGLKAFKEDYPEAKCYVVYGGHEQEYKGDITLLPLLDCLRSLQNILACVD